MSPALRHAAPTAATARDKTSSSEGRADPHGVWWTRGASPIDAHLYAAADIAGKDMAAESKVRHTDDKGDGTGTGRRASGFRVPNGDGGTLVFVTGGGTETWALASGEGDSIEILSVTSWSGSSIRIYW